MAMGRGGYAEERQKLHQGSREDMKLLVAIYFY